MFPSLNLLNSGPPWLATNRAVDCKTIFFLNKSEAENGNNKIKYLHFVVDIILRVKRDDEYTVNSLTS